MSLKYNTLNITTIIIFILATIDINRELVYSTNAKFTIVYKHVNNEHNNNNSILFIKWTSINIFASLNSNNNKNGNVITKFVTDCNSVKRNTAETLFTTFMFFITLDV